MKKIISVFLFLLSIFNFSVTAFAANAKITADDVSVSAGDIFEITYQLSNNPGIMGFAFEIDFDDSELNIISVKKGSAFSSGVFNDSVTENTTNNVKVVWTGTENCCNDGELMTVTFKAKEDSTGKTTVKIKCLNGDTFNEKWEDVNISCTDISVSIEGGEKPSVWDRIYLFINKIIDFIKSLFA